MSLLLALASGGISAEAADSVSFSDSAVSTTQRLAVAVDTVSFSDSAVCTPLRIVTADDTVAFSDSAVSITTRVAVGVDSVTFSDSAIGIGPNPPPVPGGGGNLATDPRYMAQKRRRYRNKNVEFKPAVEESIVALEATTAQAAQGPVEALLPSVLPRVVLPDLSLPRVILPPPQAIEEDQPEYRPVRRLLERVVLEPVPEPETEPEQFLQAVARADAVMLEQENDRRRKLLIMLLTQFDDEDETV